MLALLSRTLRQPAALRRPITGIYAAADPRQSGGVGMGGAGVSGPAGPARHRVAGLWVRPAPRGRRRPYRGDRQRDPQTDARGKAAGRGRLVLCDGPLDRRDPGRGRRGRHGDGAGRVLRPVQGGRQRHRHRRLGGVPVRHRRRQPDHPARRLADLPARAQGRPLRRGGFRSPAQQPRPARAPVPPAVPTRQRELAHVSARLPVRARVRHRDRGGAARAFRRPRPPKACRSGR